MVHETIEFGVDQPFLFGYSWDKVIVNSHDLDVGVYIDVNWLYRSIHRVWILTFEQEDT